MESSQKFRLLVSNDNRRLFKAVEDFPYQVEILDYFWDMFMKGNIKSLKSYSTTKHLLSIFEADDLDLGDNAIAIETTHFNLSIIRIFSHDVHTMTKVNVRSLKIQKEHFELYLTDNYSGEQIKYRVAENVGAINSDLNDCRRIVDYFFAQCESSTEDAKDTLIFDILREKFPAFNERISISHD